MENEENNPGYPNDKEDNLPCEAGKDKHLEGLTEDEKRMIRLMADVFVKSILDS